MRTLGLLLVLSVALGDLSQGAKADDVEAIELFPTEDRSQIAQYADEEADFHRLFQRAKLAYHRARRHVKRYAPEIRAFGRHVVRHVKRYGPEIRELGRRIVRHIDRHVPGFAKFHGKVSRHVERHAPDVVNFGRGLVRQAKDYAPHIGGIAQDAGNGIDSYVDN